MTSGQYFFTQPEGAYKDYRRKTIWRIRTTSCPKFNKTLFLNTGSHSQVSWVSLLTIVSHFWKSCVPYCRHRWHFWPPWVVWHPSPCWGGSTGPHWNSVPWWRRGCHGPAQSKLHGHFFSACWMPCYYWRIAVRSALQWLHQLADCRNPWSLLQVSVNWWHPRSCPDGPGRVVPPSSISW